jgi:hypothetical protein
MNFLRLAPGWDVFPRAGPLLLPGPLGRFVALPRKLLVDRGRAGGSGIDCDSHFVIRQCEFHRLDGDSRALERVV